MHKIIVLDAFWDNYRCHFSNKTNKIAMEMMYETKTSLSKSVTFPLVF